MSKNNYPCPFNTNLQNANSSFQKNPNCIESASGDIASTVSGQPVDQKTAASFHNDFGTTHPVDCSSSAVCAPSPHHLAPGTILHNRYQLGCILGEGGNGITYIGYDLVLQLKVAVKEYFPILLCTRDITYSNTVRVLSGISSTNYARGMAKYLMEARFLARMEKQRVIVNVRDYFEENGTSYIIMEYLEGITFADLAHETGGKIEQEQLFRIIEPLFGALCSLHQTGLIHRDVCPDNLMLEYGVFQGKCKSEKIQESSFREDTATPWTSRTKFGQAGTLQSAAASDRADYDIHTGRQNIQDVDSYNKMQNMRKESERDETLSNRLDITCPLQQKEKEKILSMLKSRFTQNDQASPYYFRIRLLDFGSARSPDYLKDTLTLTVRHGFAPIEQYQQGGGQGAWTDVYGLSATIYCLLTGVTPPVATNRIIEDSLIPPSKMGIEISPQREKALLKGLRLQPNQRFRDVKKLWAALYQT